MLLMVPEVTKEQLAQRLRELCAERGWGSTDLARKILADEGVKGEEHKSQLRVLQPQVSAWLNGREPGLTKALVLARAFGITVDQLLIDPTTDPELPGPGRPRLYTDEPSDN